MPCSCAAQRAAAMQLPRAAQPRAHSRAASRPRAPGVAPGGVPPPRLQQPVGVASLAGPQCSAAAMRAMAAGSRRRPSAPRREQQQQHRPRSGSSNGSAVRLAGGSSGERRCASGRQLQRPAHACAGERARHSARHGREPPAHRRHRRQSRPSTVPAASICGDESTCRQHAPTPLTAGTSRNPCRRQRPSPRPAAGPRLRSQGRRC